MQKTQLSREQRTYFEKEVEPQERAAGDDGETGSVSAGDGFWHVRRALEREEKEGAAEPHGCLLLEHEAWQPSFSMLVHSGTLGGRGVPTFPVLKP